MMILRYSANAAQGIAELVARVTIVGEEVAQPGQVVNALEEQQRRAIAILDVGGVNQGMGRSPSVSVRIGRLRPSDLLTCIIAARTAGFGGLDAITPAPGEASRRPFTRVVPALRCRLRQES